MNLWTWYFGIGLLVMVLVAAWDLYSRVLPSFSSGLIDRLISLVAAIAVVPIWPIVLVIQLKDIAKYIADPPQRYAKFRFKRSHLIRRVGVQEADELERIFDPLGAVPDAPFGFLNEAWRNFHSQIRPIDSLWIISAKAIHGFQLEEREGYAIVRFGWIRRTMLTSRIKIGGEKR
jgi:hypothetical protein